MTVNLFTTCFTEQQAHCRDLLLRKKIPFKIVLLADNAPGHPRALMEMSSEINVFMPDTTSILQPKDQGVISTFRSYYLTNTLRKAIATIDSDSSDGSGKSPLKTFQKGFIVLDVT